MYFGEKLLDKIENIHASNKNRNKESEYFLWDCFLQWTLLIYFLWYFNKKIDFFIKKNHCLMQRSDL